MAAAAVKSSFSASSLNFFVQASAAAPRFSLAFFVAALFCCFFLPALDLLMAWDAFAAFASDLEDISLPAADSADAYAFLALT